MTCPKCGSDNIASTYVPGIYRCRDCGAIIRTKGPKEEGAAKAFNLKSKEK